MSKLLLTSHTRVDVVIGQVLCIWLLPLRQELPLGFMQTGSGRSAWFTMTRGEGSIKQTKAQP